MSFTLRVGQTIVALLLKGYSFVTQLFPALVMSLRRHNPLTSTGVFAGIVIGVATVEGTCVLSVTSWAYGMCSKARRIEATLRVNVQLTSGETGAHLWSDRFDEEISELAAGQEHIVTRMRSELGISMSRSRRRAASASGRPTPTRSISFCGRALWKTSHQTFNERRSKGTLRAGAGARPCVGTRYGWNRCSSGGSKRDERMWAISTPCIVLRLLTQERAIAPETERLPVVTVYWLRIADRCGEAMLAAEEAIRRFSNGVGAYAVLGHCKTETGHAEEEIPLQAQAIRLNLAIHICSIATDAWASPR